VRYWFLKPITLDEAYDIAITPVNVQMMKRRLTQMGMTPTAAQRRIESVQKRLDEMRFA
jgi:Fe2+ transport system protein FeoA